MSKETEIKAPTLIEKISLRLLITLGLLSLLNFFYWFLNPHLIYEPILYWLLFFTIAYESLRIIYIWYHYFNISIPVKPTSRPKFTVDVLTTYFPGEPYEMVKQTLLAIQKISYPHTTYLCDEANDNYLKEFCRENNIIHVTRNNRIDAKAGNINNALLQAKGDICLIIDPDHIPVENILDEIIPYFEDEHIGFVQTVQAYYNVKQSLVAKGAAEQTFQFYGPIMMSMNSYGTVNAIGANCVFRRKALDSIGGHAAGLSEDMHTAMQLYAKGWKSVYVPKVLTKGLAPASLTSYYKQQLKWSRGTFELLVSVYPKLFKNFSWRQKIHYGILPFHYFSGIIILINFLIPIISLFTANMPWRGNMVNFGLIFGPVIVSVIGIRSYVQHWLIHRNERGFHWIGGILQICTWWIYIIGLVYTIIRKKVPYLPTPKEDNERTTWKLLIPNLLIAIVSTAAIIYGLSIDLTPFSIIMAAFALLNASFMFYTIIFAYQKKKIIFFSTSLAEKSISKIKNLQNIVFDVWWKLALPIFALVLSILVVIEYNLEYSKWGGVTPEVQNKILINYLGAFAPNSDIGIASLKNVRDISNQIDEKFDIISFNMAWNKNIEFSVYHSLIDSIYAHKSIPLITWEPQLDSADIEINDKKHVFECIGEGFYDMYITHFAQKVKNFNHPIFLRFAPEFDNPYSPLDSSAENASIIFKKAWIHTYEIFKKSGAHNVIWIWNPWKSENIPLFYPGEEYVDWIGVNILNFGSLNQDGKWHNFDFFYDPFHDEMEKLPLTPVIISEFGTTKENQNQDEWISDAFESIHDEYKEISAVIYFNSEVNNNWPVRLKSKKFHDWTIANYQVIKNSFKINEVPNYVFNEFPILYSDETNELPIKINKLKNIKGINLKKGHNWIKDYHVLDRQSLLDDFTKIKQLGINTIKFEENSVYEYNVLTISKEFDLNVSFGFWIPADVDFVNDSLKKVQLRQNILGKVAKRKNVSNITSWNIQNDVLYNQKDFYLKPRLFYQNRAYIKWLKNLVADIKKMDPTRPIIVDLEINQQSIYHSKLLIDYVGGIDYFGLVVKEDEHLDQLLSFLKRSNIALLYSEIEVEVLTKSDIFATNPLFFITAWQDAHESNKLTFDGIIDRKGRYKTDYFTILNSIQGSNVELNQPKIRILKPASLLSKNGVFDYHAMYYDDVNGWNYGTTNKELKFEWSLVKCDMYGNYLAVKDIEQSAKLSLKIPDNYNLYKLLLTTTKGKTISTTITSLNTPLR